MSDESTEASPWAGDSIAPSAGLGEVAWPNMAPSAPPRPTTPPIAAKHAGPVWEAPGNESPNTQLPTTPHTTSRGPWLAVACAGLGLLVVTSVLWPRSTRPDISGAAFDEMRAEVRPTIPRTTVPTTNDTIPPRPNSTIDLGVFVETDGTLLANVPVDVVELPAVVTAMTGSAELLAVNGDGQLVTVSIPSGNVSITDLGLDPSGYDYEEFTVIAGPDAALAAKFGSPPVVVPRNGEPIVVADPTGSSSLQSIPLGWFDRSPEPSGFIVVELSDSGVYTTVIITADGERSISPTQLDSTFLGVVASTGVHVLNDSGGGYVMSVDGTAERFTEGDILATAGDLMLLRECTTQLECAFWLQRVDGTDRRRVALDDVDLGQRFNWSLSPDGATLSVATVNDGTVSHLDLVTGGSTSFSTRSSGFFSNSWSPDGTGEFRHSSDGGFVFLDRASGDSMEFGVQLGPLSPVGVRVLDTPAG